MNNREATQIVKLLGYDGPNLYGPRPSVVLQVYTLHDHSRAIRAALKDAALNVGIIIGYLVVEAIAADAGFLITATFVTPLPAFGMAIARYVVDGLNAQLSGDDAWDAEEPLWLLQQRRRAEMLPFAALQIVAEATKRGVPTFQRGASLLQLGYGAHSFSLDLAPFRQKQVDASPNIPWDALGSIPIIAVSGGANRDSTAQRIAEALHAQGHAVGLALDADFDETRALLSAPHTAIVVGLATTGIAARGLGFERCAATVITDLPTELPLHIADRAELARLLGVPMLVTDPAGIAVLNANTPEITAVEEYAPCRVVGLEKLHDLWTR